jgi:hypothetical protein
VTATWSRSKSGLWLPLATDSGEDAENEVPDDHGESLEEGVKGALSLPSVLGLVGSLATVTGAVAFAFTWAYFTTFYARFGLTPEQVGLDFAAVGVRTVFLMFWFWVPVALLSAIRIAFKAPITHYLTPGVLIGVGATAYCWSFARQLSHSIINPGNYAENPRMFLLVLPLLILCRWASLTAVAGRIFGTIVEFLLVIVAVVALALSTYGGAEVASRLVADETDAVRIVGFPDVELLSVPAVDVYPSGATEGNGFGPLLKAQGKPSHDPGPDPISRSSVIDLLIRNKRCTLLLGSADGRTYLWVPTNGLVGTPTGWVYTVPSNEIIVQPHVGSGAGPNCVPAGNQSEIELPLVTLP